MSENLKPTSLGNAASNLAAFEKVHARILNIMEGKENLGELTNDLVAIVGVLDRVAEVPDQLLQECEHFAKRLGTSLPNYQPGRMMEFQEYILDLVEALLYCWDPVTQGLDSVNLGAQMQKLRKNLEENLKEKRKKNRQARKKGATHRRNKVLAEVMGLSELPEQTHCFDVDTSGKLHFGEADLKAISTCVTGFPTFDQFSDQLADQDFYSTVPDTNHTGLFEAGMVGSSDLEEKNVKVFRYGLVLGFKRSSDHCHRLVFAARFFRKEDFSKREQQQLAFLGSWFSRADKYAYEVKHNKSQNAGDNLEGRLKMWGWRPERLGDNSATLNQDTPASEPNVSDQGPRKKPRIALYVPKQAHREEEEFAEWEKIHKESASVSLIWMLLHMKMNRRGVLQTSAYLKKLLVPIFGNISSDLKDHTPGIGSNLAFSTHDQNGQGYANGMHIDSDVDRNTTHKGAVLTSGTWLHADAKGEIVWDTSLIKDAIDGGHFYFPDFGFSLDLGAAPIITAMWRGGIDRHGTTRSTIKMDRGITRFGSSMQTNRVLATRAARVVQSEVAGLEEHRLAYLK